MIGDDAANAADNDDDAATEDDDDDADNDDDDYYQGWAHCLCSHPLPWSKCWRLDESRGNKKKQFSYFSPIFIIKLVWSQ